MSSSMVINVLILIVMSVWLVMVYFLFRGVELVLLFIKLEKIVVG